MMTLKIVLIICFSILALPLFTGCFTLSFSEAHPTWTRPPEPETVPIDWQRQGDGYYLSREDSTNLVNNVDEMKAYIKKLEFLVDTMEKYYKK